MDAYLIDEIGKMECHCPQFVATMKCMANHPLLLERPIGGAECRGVLDEVHKRHTLDRGRGRCQSSVTTGTGRLPRGQVRAIECSELQPDGFNVGVNDGPAAGQTVMHAHVHVIPRRKGDVADPRGGVRWVMPGKAAYWGEGQR